MQVDERKRPNEDSLEKLAERIAAEINERAARITPEDRAKADSEIRKIAAQRSAVLPEYRFDFLV